MFKVTVDDEAFDAVVSWYTPGGTLLVLDFADGSTRGLSGFVNFVIEPIVDKTQTDLFNGQDGPISA